MAHPQVIVIGTSAGGLAALQKLVSELPADLPVPICIVQHLPAEYVSYLPEILGKASPLPVQHAVEGQPAKAGHIYVAPPNYHLLLETPGRISLGKGPKENLNRPSINVLFRSVAPSYGPRVIGVLLTGSLDDGVAGLYEIKRKGGIAVVQEPEDAAYPAMPEYALAQIENIDHVVPIADLAALLVRLSQPAAPEESHPDALALASERRKEVVTMQENGNSWKSLFEHGDASGLICPDCGGSLWQVPHERLLEYHCHVGHRYSAITLYACQVEKVEKQLWASVRALREQAVIATNLARNCRAMAGREEFVVRYEMEATTAESQADYIETMIRRP